MRAIVQRVAHAEVEVDSAQVGRIDRGLLVYLGVGVDDGPEDARRLADKVARLRIFADGQGKMNLSVRDVGGGVLAIPNFTLMADARKGRRPAFVAAAGPQQAEPLYEVFLDALRDLGCEAAAGKFRAHMDIRSTADGPVNIILEMPPAESGPNGR